MKKSRLLGAVCASICFLVSTTVNAVFVPMGLGPGDTYQLVFVARDFTSATSPDINYYNNFAQTQAQQKPLLTGTDQGIEYDAIISTSSVNAIIKEV